MGTARLWGTAIVLTLPSFLWGYVTSNLNACTPKDESEGSLALDVSEFEHDLYKEVATAIVIAGAWLGSSISGNLTQRFGQKRLLVFDNLLFIIGGILSVFSSFASICVGRTILGFSIGVSGTIVPMLLSEISPSEIRGTITTLHQLMITIGILFAGLMGWGFVPNVAHGWRFVQGFTVIPAVLQLIFTSLIPESPRWLVRAKQNVDSQGSDQPGALTLARQVLSQYTADPHSPELEERLRAMGEADPQEADWTEVFRTRKPLLIGLTLMFFLAMTGINTVIFYSTNIFEIAGFDQPIIGTVSIGAVNVITTIASVFLVDRLGRRTLLIIGTAGMTFSLFFNSAILLALNSHEKVQGIVAVIATLMYVISFAVGLGAVVWVLLSEIMPSRVRSKAFSLFLAKCWFWNLLLSLGSLTVIDSIGNGDEKRGVAYLFIIFGFLSFASLLFSIFILPETKGISLDGAEHSDYQAISQSEPYINERLSTV